MSLGKQEVLTAFRAEDYADLLGCMPPAALPPSTLFVMPDEWFLIDILVYTPERARGLPAGGG